METMLWILLVFFNFNFGVIYGDVLGKGVISAFGDFNADKHTDFFVIGDEGNVLSFG